MYSTVNPAPRSCASRARRSGGAYRRRARATAAGDRGLEAAVAAEDKVGYGEPPDWLFPTREGLGAALMRAGNAG